MQHPLSMVVLISGNGSNLQAIIDNINNQQINGHIKAVISNNEQAYGITRAKKAGITTHTLNHKLFSSRDKFDQQLIKIIDQYQPDLIVLAGFMRRLNTSFVNHYEGRILNIHPSILPAYPGLNTHQRVLEQGEKEHGASVHFVTSELDAGPIIIQSIIAIHDIDTIDTLTSRIHQQEYIIYPLAISWFAKGRLKQIDNKTYLDGKHLTTPIQIKKLT